MIELCRLCREAASGLFLMEAVCRRRGVEDYSNLSVTMNEEWRHMFGNSDAAASSRLSDTGMKT